jgi:hypothetical protein
VVRDLRLYAQALDAQVLRYHANKGLEAAAIVEPADGRRAAQARRPRWPSSSGSGTGMSGPMAWL